MKKILDNPLTHAYKPELADGVRAPMATMKTEEEKETQTQSKDCSRSASQYRNVSTNETFRQSIIKDVRFGRL